jgi:hypothetical protein
MLIGAGFFSLGLSMFPRRTSAPGFSLLIGGSVTLLAGSALLIIGAFNSAAATRSLRSAFESWPKDLRLALDL